MKLKEEKDPFKEKIRALHQEEELVPSPSDEELWEKVLGEINQSSKMYKLVFGWYLAAASVLLAFSLGLSYYFHHNKPSDKIAFHKKEVRKEVPFEAVNDIENQKKQIVALPKKKSSNKKNTVKPVVQFSQTEAIKTTDKVEKYALSDGSQVTLNSQSHLLKDKNFDNQRNVELEGEGFFEVKSNATKPFTVYFGEARLVVVGTKFNVHSFPRDYYQEITVTEGIVKVFTSLQPKGVTVKKGQQVKVQDKTILLPREVDVQAYVSWKNSKLHFTKANMEDVSFILSKHFNTYIEVSPLIRNCAFSGDLTGLSLDESLNVLKTSASLRVERADNSIRLSGSACE